MRWGGNMLLLPVISCLLLALLASLQQAAASDSVVDHKDSLEALLALKSRIVDKHRHLQDWVAIGDDHEARNSPSCYCGWSGVSCNERGDIVSLDLASRNLSGTIAPDVGRLWKLVTLTLADNRFSGSLPPEIARISGLKSINVSRNCFNETLPAELSTLASLEVLDCYNNNLSGHLPFELSRLVSLKWLHLGGNYFQGSIPPQYGNLQNLTYLALNANYLSGKIPPELGYLAQLEQMYLGYFNSFDGGIPYEFGGLINLVRLDMSSCNLSRNIPASLGSLSRLDTLYLQINQLTGEIPAELGNLTSLTYLDLSENELTGSIPEEFRQLRKLELVNLFMNDIGGRIPSFIAHLPRLQVLQLWQNNMTGHVPQQLGQSQQLTTLDLSFNSFSGPIPLDLCLGGKLESLILMTNFFTGSMPHSLTQCPSLDRIRLGQNRLTGTVPPCLFNLPNLTILELPQNFLTGGLPFVFSLRSPLSLVDLSNNYLSGMLPASFGNLLRLETLLLSGNRIKGEIPAEIWRMETLTLLNLSNNCLNGSITQAIGSCQALIILDVSHNKLRGEIPPHISNLTSLDYLNVSFNELSGSIPSSLQEMQCLITVDFSFNNLSGEIPTGGQFENFNSSIFEGNAYLCGRQMMGENTLRCSSGQRIRRSFGLGGDLVYWASLLLTVILISVVGLVYLGWMLWQSACLEEKPWVLTTYQNIGLEVHHVLGCLANHNIIGKGAGGIVYRGMMPDGRMIAVKKLESRCKGLPSEGAFAAEIQILGKIRHRYIVRLLGWCSNGETDLLVFEYMANGSLGQMLHGTRVGLLEWAIRYKVAVEAAKGLCYLHHDCNPRILHRDVKSNNILLDSNFEAHVADFGLAKYLEGTEETLSVLAGSFGYIAPEYSYTLKVDEKSDIYSFGIVLLELVTGRRPVEPEYGDGGDIARWVRGKIKSKSGLCQILDARLLTSNYHSMDSKRKDDDGEEMMQMQEMARVLQVALLCIDESPVRRPSMQEVLQMLNLPQYNISNTS